MQELVQRARGRLGEEVDAPEQHQHRPEVPPHELEAAAHDRIFAAVSHLPHVLAFALVDLLATRPDAAEVFRYAASGFRDFTRIAAGSPEMWRDIAIANRVALLETMDAYRAQLDRTRGMLAAADAEALERMFAHASEARRAWGTQFAGKPVGADEARDR